MDSILRKQDPEVEAAITAELKRQQNNLELIASENFTSVAVLEAQGTSLTNKYCEGYPGKRYYGGCHEVDKIEILAIERAKSLFGAEYANVQPHAGAQANMAVYLAALKPGDKVLGLALAHGGHLTHGSPVNASGVFYDFIQYGVNEKDEQIDYDEVENIAKKHRPKAILAGATAYPREIDFKRFREIADEVGAYLIVDMAHIAGLVAGGVHQSPVPVADFVSSTAHKTLRGPRSGFILCREQYGQSIDKAVFPGMQGGPLMHVIAAKAVAFKEAATEEFKSYQHQVVKNAKILAQAVAKDEGIRLVSGGTDNHLFLVDLSKKQVSGIDAQNALDNVNITVNKNTIPFDKLSPFVTSGIRVGTPAVTTRGMKEEQMEKIGELIVKTLDNLGDTTIYEKVREEVSNLVSGFPLYESLEERV